jgi:glycosyltransferase involved in cell wall biosynthesis
MDKITQVTMKTDKQEKIKVIELISSMRMGGAESLVREYALKLDKTQFRVMVVSIEGRSGSPNEAMLDENEVNSIYIDDMIRTYRFLPRKINSLLKYIRRRQILVSEIRNIRPDVIHIHMAIKIAACIPYRFLLYSS